MQKILKNTKIIRYDICDSDYYLISSFHQTMSMANSHNTVFVGLSGGVDSSVSAKRLLAEGYTVVGVFIKTWQPDFLPCTWEAERLDAMRVAAHLKIPFYTCDAEKIYREDVAEYMVCEYTRGRTPNPDVMCNKYVKFGAFLEYAKEHGAGKIATGHYARTQKIEGRMHLLRAKDTEKDQSYFLWTLTQEQLECVLFPIGDTKKPNIRAEAKKAGLLTFEKRDSQGICFLGDVDMKAFLSHFIKTTPGDVLDSSGTIIGRHDGAALYTIGQRHGFSVFAKTEKSTPHYIIAKDVVKNTLTVGEFTLTQEVCTVILSHCNFIQEIPKTCEAQFRYRQKPQTVQVLHTSTGLTLTISDMKSDIPTPGQSCVLYQGDECLGGGIIEAISY